MHRVTVLTRDAETTRALGREIGLRMQGGEVVFLSGPLGAGKTTLVQGIAAGLGISGRVQSPSFVLERRYRGRTELRHLDFYRLNESDVQESGFLAEADGSTVTVVEWAERAGDCPDATLRLRLDPVPGARDTRSITIETLSREWEERIRDAVKGLGVVG